MTNDLIIKIGLLVLGTMLTMVAGLVIWGFQRLVTTMLENGVELVRITGRLAEIDKKLHSLEIRKEHKFGEIDKKLAAMDRIEKEQNTYMFRLKLIESKLGELSAN